MSVLEVTDLVAGYGDLIVLRGISFSVSGGELVILTGPNGAGKTTLLSTLIGTVRTTSGDIRLDGQDIASLPVTRRTQMGLGLVPEGRGLFPSLTVWENLRVAAKVARLSREQTRVGMELAEHAFPIIAERLSQKVSLLSGGEQQMVAFGRALLAQPQVMLLDEPSMGLAPIIWRQVLEACRRIADEGRVVVVAEQRILEALDAADRCIVLGQGAIIRDDDVTDAASAVPELTSAYFSGRSS